MKITKNKQNISHGSGEIDRKLFGRLDVDVVFEKGVLVFHPQNIEIGKNVYIGHYTILKGYHQNKMIIGDYTWIGQGCFIHSAGGVIIGKAAGIGPMVKIISSTHTAEDLDKPVLFSPLKFEKVVIKDGCDIGIGTTILPGTTIGEGAIIGANSVVTKDVPDYEVWAGVPIKFIKKR